MFLQFICRLDILEAYDSGLKFPSTPRFKVDSDAMLEFPKMWRWCRRRRRRRRRLEDVVCQL